MNTGPIIAQALRARPCSLDGDYFGTFTQRIEVITLKTLGQPAVSILCSVRFGQASGQLPVITQVIPDTAGANRYGPDPRLEEV